MATKRGKKSPKKVKSLKTKALSMGKATRVRGGLSFTKQSSAQSKIPGSSSRIVIS